MSMNAVKVYLEVDLAREIAHRARASGRSESSLVAEAVRARYANSETMQAAGAETQKRQLNRLESRLDKLLRDQAMLKECMLLFVRVWLEHNPPVDEAIAESTAASAQARFERFLDLVMTELGRSVANGAHNGAASEANEHTGARA